MKMAVRKACLAIAVGWGLLALTCGPGLAGTGSVVSKPANLALARNGLTVRVDGRWLNGNGIRPVRVTLSHFPPGPAGVNRRVTVSLSPYGPRRDRPCVTVSEVVDLPGDVASIETVICVPQWADWHGCEMEVTERGERLRELSGDLVGFSTLGNGREWTETLPSLLLIDRDIPPWSGRAASGTAWIRASGLAATGPDGEARQRLPNLLPYEQALPAVGDRQQVIMRSGFGTTTQIVTSEPEDKAAALPASSQGHPGDIAVASEIQSAARMEMLALEDVPDRWTELSSADLIYISLDDLAQLATAFPAKAHALRDWVAAGQVLLVSQVGPDQSRAGELEKLLGMQHDLAAIGGWKAPMASDYGVGFLDATTLMTNTTVTVSTDGKSPPARFRLGRLGTGRVIAFDDEHATDDMQQFLWALNALDTADWAWFQRFGQSQHRENAGFGEMRIIGVGDPPVYSFLVLISVFTLAIGPVNYWMLKRRRRLYLLLVTVPIGAAIVTVLLLVYALLSDGLGVRGRVKSVTLLDRSVGRAVTWSRQAYYAGMTPSRGLIYPESSLVVPFEASPDPQRQRRASAPELNWTNGQTMRGGFLRARELTQFTVVDAGPSSARLDVDWTQRTVRNELGATIREVFVRGEDGTWLVATGIGRGEQAQLVPSAASQVQIAVRNATAFVVDESVELPRSRRYRWYWNSVDSNVRAPATFTSVLEKQIVRIRNLRDLPPRCFVATLEQAEWLPVAVEQASYDDSLHIVAGNW